MSTALREPLSKIEPTIMAFSKKYKDFLNKPLKLDLKFKESKTAMINPNAYTL
jgi:hypothetical protein